MSKTYKVAVLVGSLRKESLSRKLALAMIGLAPSELNCSLVEIGDLPLFNDDLETETPPAAWKRFREEVAPVDAVLFFTPEYNRGVTAALKNAIDVGSRPYGKSVWVGKPGAVVSSSPGATGGFGAHHHLRQTLVSLNVPTMPQPEVYVGEVHKILGEDGKINNERSEKFLRGFMTSFAKWVEANHG